MTYLSEKQIRAVRKRHLCEACDKFIEIGEPATNWCGTNDGGFASAYYHQDCREAEIAFNRQIGVFDGDDWQRLCEAESENKPWIKTNWPVPYLRMCMTREQYAARSDEGAGK